MTSDLKVLKVPEGPRELSAFSVDRGQLARTAVHGAELQERGIFRATAKRLPKEA